MIEASATAVPVMLNPLISQRLTASDWVEPSGSFSAGAPARKGGAAGVSGVAAGEASK